GSKGDAGRGIAADAAGNAFVVGFTGSPNFPVVNPFQATNKGVDAFVTKLSADGSALFYSTYLGSSFYDYGYAVGVDTAGSAYVTGQVQFANDFPTVNAFQPDFGGWSDAFVTKFTPQGDALVYSSYLGGSGEEYGGGIAVDRRGNAYVVGAT